MRVIAGIARGRKLISTKGTKTRPPLDRIKESLFSILGSEIENERVLDLFAGSGSLGIEALSRGASSVTFVENSIDAIRAIKRNLENTGFVEESNISKKKVLDFIKDYAGKEQPFDLIFLDPPFRISVIDIENIFEVLRHDRFLSKSALIVMRLYAQRKSPGISGFEVVKDRIYGDSRLLFYRKA